MTRHQLRDWYVK